MNQTSKSIIRFILRSVTVIGLPVALPIAWYVAEDPYKVLRHYECYFPNPGDGKAEIGLNKGMVTFANFKDRVNEGMKYDSFIFGSSISCYYDADTWGCLVMESMADSVRLRSGPVSPYHFDSASETLMSMARKVRYLDREGVPIRHALIVLDPIIMGSEASDAPPYVDPPKLHDSFLETLKYHYVFFRAAVNADFFKSWLPASLRHKPVEMGRNLIFERQPIVYDKKTNQERIPQWDSLIRVDSRSFYRDHPLVESPKRLSVGKQTLTPERKKSLEDIAGIFRRQSTDYRIIIGPNRRKVTLNPEDLNILRSVFDPDKVYDFSSSLAFILEEDTMLYDNTHYRPPVAEMMMRKVYLE